MKRYLTIVNRVIPLGVLLFVMPAAYAGGLLTNTNQSAQWMRMLSRNASTQIDAVYFNPAGLIKFEDGWHFAISNQSIWQEKPVNSYFPLLNFNTPENNNREYTGKVKALVFPNAYAVYKKNDLAFSLGIGPVAGGGSATYDLGLPSFEIPITKLVPALAGLSQIPEPAKFVVTGYDADLYFDGSSVFWGFQVGATYKFNDVVSGFAGVRVMPSTNTYYGYIRDIQLEVNGTMVPVGTWMTGTAVPAITGIANQAKGAATSYNGAATSVQQLITAGAGNFTIAQVQTAGYISSAQRATFEGALSNLGLTSAQIAALKMNQVKTYFSNAAASYQASANQLTATSTSLTAYAGTLGDKEVDAKQTGTGWTPIIGANITVGEQLNIGVKYEFKTKLELTNSTSVDDLGLFKDGNKDTSDIPAFLAVGIGYKPTDRLEAQLSFNTYFDENVDWGSNVRESVYGRSVEREIDNNFWELALGLQYNLNDKIAVSAGGMMSRTGIADNWQSDFDYSNPAVTAAMGIQWKITDQLTFDAGFMKVFYKDVSKTFDDPDIGPYEEIYGQKTMGFALGLSYSIF